MVSPHDGHLAYPAYNTRRHDIPTDAVDDFQFLDRKNEDDFGFGRNGQRYLGHVRTPQRSGDEYPNIPSDYRETRTRRRQMSQVSEGDSTDGTVVRQLLEEVLSTLKGRRPSSAVSFTMTVLKNSSSYGFRIAVTDMRDRPTFC